MEYACASTFSLNTHINFSKSTQKKNWGHVFKCDTTSIAREDVPRGGTQGSASNLKLSNPLQAALGTTSLGPTVCMGYIKDCRLGKLYMFKVLFR